MSINNHHVSLPFIYFLCILIVVGVSAEERARTSVPNMDYNQVVYGVFKNITDDECDEMKNMMRAPPNESDSGQ